MAKSKAKKRATAKRNGDGVVSGLWNFVEQNPQIALALAFEIGALINEATRSRGNVKKMLIQQLEKGASLLPEILAGQEHKIPPAIKILAGPAIQAAIVAAGSKAPRNSTMSAVKSSPRRKSRKAVKN